MFSSIKDRRYRTGPDQLSEKFWLDPVIRLGGAVGRAPELRVVDPGSSRGSGENVSFILKS